MSQSLWGRSANGWATVRDPTPQMGDAGDVGNLWRRSQSLAAMRAVVVKYGAPTDAVGNHRVRARVGQLDIERFVGFLLLVALDLDGERLGGLPGSERQSPGRGHVVGPGLCRI